MRRYKAFFCSVIVFYAADLLWGTFTELKIIPLAYITAMAFFMSMVWSVLKWTQFVIEYLKRNNRFTELLSYGAWAIFIFEILALMLNFILPVVFSYDDGEYHTYFGRLLTLIAQVVLYLFTTFYSMVEAHRQEDGIAKMNHASIGISGLIMAAFILFQALMPNVPFYSMGCIIAGCIIHTFVVQGEKLYHTKELGSVKMVAYRDPLTGVKNKQAFQEMKADVDMRIDTLQLKDFGIIVFDVNGLKQVNDNLGHEEGDRYIISGCEVICKTFQHSAVYRIGGDEFVAILEGDDYLQRLDLLDQFDQMMEEHVREGGVVVSAGLDIFRAGRDGDFNSIFERADQRMYEKKKYLKSLKTDAAPATPA
ncbi:MAG: GGDEF domain-containing protein [Clostridiales bacterium]|jgi:diguanylate cyclase (GGDEF)-like protein|nr:GGDEF domain-containing protein [Clostridiales bacterium]